MSKRFEASWESLAQFRVPEWYQKAKFGIFVHWGPYAVPAFDNEWYSRNMYLQGSRAFEYHRKTWGSQDVFGYKDFIPLFKGEHFDAAAWVGLFKEAGAKYLVSVAEHHDGFALYDCSFSEWTAVKMGPKRDVIGELAAASRQQGLVFGLSNHRAEHWWFMNGGLDYASDVQDPAYADFYGPPRPGPRMEDAKKWHSRDWEPRPDAVFLEDWLARNLELVDRYQPQLVYFDWWIRQIVFAPYLQRFAAHYYNRGDEWGAEVAINCKNEAFPQDTAVFEVERGQFKHSHPRFWQADTSVSRNSWAYIQDHDYKPASSLIHELVDIVSKNGALLLNIGPKADGSIPEEEVAILREFGRWLGINGEAIYETNPWKVYGEGPTKVKEGSFQDAVSASFGAKDVRFTSKGEVLYATVLGWPENGEVLIRALGSGRDLYTQAIGKVSLLGWDGELVWKRHHKGLQVKLPSGQRFDPAFVLKIEA